MSKHGFGAIADSAHRLGEGVVDAAHTAQSGTASAIHAAAALVHTLEKLGLDDVLGVVGLQRKRSSFSFATLLGGAAIGAGVVAIAALAIPQAPKARRAVRHFVRSAVDKAQSTKDHVVDRMHQNGQARHEASA